MTDFEKGPMKLLGVRTKLEYTVISFCCNCCRQHRIPATSETYVRYEANANFSIILKVQYL